MNHTQQSLEAQAAFVLAEAARLGATDCEVSICLTNSWSCGVRLGQVEKLDGSQFLALAFRALVGHRSAVTTTTNLSCHDLTSMVGNTIELAKASEPDVCAGLPDAGAFATSWPDLKLFDAGLGLVDVNTKIKMAIAAEQAALAADNRITNSDGASFSNENEVIVLANSRGFLQSYTATGCSLVVSIVASDEDGSMQSGFWWNSARAFSDLQDPASIGVEAARRALSQLGARKVQSQAVPVVLDPLMSARFLRQFISAADGNKVYRKNTFLAGQLGKVVAAPQLVIVDDGHIPGGHGSTPFDAEGLPTSRRVLVSEGRLNCYLVDSYAGRQLGLAPNGGSTNNLYIEPGELSQEQIIASVDNGLFLTDVSGPGFNLLTGDVSFGASGFWIEGGALAFPVAEITVAGNLLEMFQDIQAIGSDLRFISATCAPTLKIGKMTVAGS